MRALTTRAATSAGAAAVCLALLAGCGMFGVGEPEPTGSSGSGTAGSSSTEPDEPDGPAPEDLSAEVLDAAAAQDAVEPIGTGTGASPNEPDVELTIEVLSVRRTADATVVLMRWLGTDGESVAATAFRNGDRGYTGVTQADTLYLVDPTTSRSRYLPLRFSDEGGGKCLCPQVGMKLAQDDAILVSATYARLPDAVQTVDLVANDGFITIPDLPVTG